MPLTYESHYAVCFESKLVKRISKKSKAADRLRKMWATRAGIDETLYDNMIHGRVIPSDYQPIALEPYLHGVENPLYLEQEARCFPLPSINAAAVAEWTNDIAKLRAQLNKQFIPKPVRTAALELANDNFTIEIERGNVDGVNAPEDYLGNYFARNTADPKFIDELESYSILHEFNDLSRMRNLDAMVKSFFATHPGGMSETELSRIVRAIEARKLLIAICQKKRPLRHIDLLKTRIF